MEFEHVDLYYEEHGQGTPVVFLHGFPFDHTIWQPLVPALSQHARLILPDLRGFGQSPVPGGVYSMREMAEDVKRLLDRLEIERAVIVGHSMGGYASLAFALAYPHHVAGLGLVATQAAADSPERRQTRLKTASSVKRRGAKVVVDQMIGKLTPRTDLVPSITELMMRANPIALIGALKGMAERPDVTGEISSICVPAVILAGNADPFIPLERAQVMDQMLPKSWLVEIASGGHMLMMEEPGQVAEALRQVIAMCS